MTNDFLDARAELCLSRLLATGRGEIEDGGDVVADDSSFEECQCASDPDLAGTLKALVGVGALSADEAEDWQARFVEAALEDDARQLDPGLVERSRGLLGEAATALAETEDGADIDRAMGALLLFSALRGARVLVAEEEAQWGSRLSQLVGSHAFEPPGVEGPQASVVNRVVAGPDSRRDGIRLTVVELFDDGVGLRWHLYRPQADGGRFEWADNDEWLDMGAELSDDVGTRYHGLGVGMRGGDRVLWGDAQFGPAVPQAARRLTVAIDNVVFEVELW